MPWSVFGPPPPPLNSWKVTLNHRCSSWQERKTAITTNLEIHTSLNATGLLPSVLSIYRKSKGIKYKSTPQWPFTNPPHWAARAGGVWVGREPVESLLLSWIAVCLPSQPHTESTGVGWGWGGALSSGWARSTGLLPSGLRGPSSSKELSAGETFLR